MNIVFSSNNITFNMMMVSIYSVLVNNQSHKLRFYILESGIPSSRKKLLESLCVLYRNVRVEFIAMDSNLFSDKLVNPRVSLQSYYRYLAPDSIAQEDKALYLDVDVLCLGDLGGLYDTNLDKKCIAGAIDTELYKRPNNLAIALGFDKDKMPYMNSGVLLMNLEEMRKMHMTATFLENLDNRHMLIPKKYDIFNDQTIMNLTFKDTNILLDSKYNTLIASLIGSEVSYEPVIVHFSGRHKPLTYYQDETKPYMETYYRLAREAEAVLETDLLHDIIILAGTRTTSYLNQ